MFATTRLPVSPVPRFAALARGAARQVGRAMGAWRAWRRRERDARTLHDMSDRDLQDIGLGRSDLPFVLDRHLDDRRRDGWW